MEEPKITDVPHNEKQQIRYKVNDIPSWRLSVILGLQHNLAMFSGAVSLPYLIASHLCTDENSPAQGILISTTFFVAGIATLLQTTFGNRLPIIQGPAFAFFIPTIAVLNQAKYKCPDHQLMINKTMEEKNEMWMSPLREVQGAIIMASLVEIFIGLTGLIGFLIQWITPLAIVPTISLIGLSLFTEAAEQSSGNWGIAALTMILLLIFSQYLGNVNVPFPSYDKKNGCRMKPFPLFETFSVTLTIVIAWAICAALTASGIFADDDKARSDIKLQAIYDADWISIPYPGQFGKPKITTGSVLGAIAGIIASVVESVGDYYACAKLSGAPPPPVHAVNRGIMMEGLGCTFCGLFGTGAGVTSFSQNIGVIGMTKVGSRRVVQYAAVIIAVCGIVGKVGAVFVAIPSPVMGGMFCVTFGIITAVGLSNLQFVNLNSTRNIFIVGFSIFMGLCLPEWFKKNPDVIRTGNESVDQILGILLQTGMFIAGFLGCFLDNTIPGTDEERGVIRWRAEIMASNDANSEDIAKCYNLPLVMDTVKKFKILNRLPISPTYRTKDFVAQHNS